MTKKDDLKAALDERGIEYNDDDTNKVLRQKLADADSNESDRVTDEDAPSPADAVRAATQTADEREYVAVPDDEKPHPSTLMHVQRVPGEDDGE